MTPHDDYWLGFFGTLIMFAFALLILGSTGVIK